MRGDREGGMEGIRRERKEGIEKRYRGGIERGEAWLFDWYKECFPVLQKTVSRRRVCREHLIPVQNLAS